jgi:pimeloyl-ACP methyl ester carboxylesterase
LQGISIVRLGLFCLWLSVAYGEMATVRNGIKLYYEVHGQGSPVVLLHGGTATIQYSFSKQIDLLARDHRVIGIEQMGHGHSPDVEGRPFSYEEMTEDTAALLTALGIRDADVIGWSDGGQIALRLAAMHPELVRRVVASGVGFGGNPASRQSTENMSDSRWPHEFRDGYVSASPDGAGHWPVVWRKACKMWAGATWGFTQADLRSIKARVLIIAGDHDIISAEVTRQVAQAIPGGEYRILPDSDHWTFQKRSDLMNPLLIEFLDRK